MFQQKLVAGPKRPYKPPATRMLIGIPLRLRGSRCCALARLLMWINANRPFVDALAGRFIQSGRFAMIIKAEMISRRKALSLSSDWLLRSASRRFLRYWQYPTLRLRQLVCSGVRSGVKGGISGVTTVARDAPSDARSGAQVQLRARLQRVQLPAQLSNSTGPARS